MPASFPQRFGPWAVIAGASAGLGAAFARALARRGMHVLLVARRGELLDDLAAELRAAHGIQVQSLQLDLAGSDVPEVLAAAVEGLEVGLAVHNAAHAPVGDFLSRPLDDLLRVVDVNVRGPLVVARTLAPAMAARGRGAIVLMSSLAGGQGAPRIATYAASKAFTTVLAEGLWQELRGSGIQVLASCPGAIRTPGYAATATRDAPGTLDAAVVAERTLDAIGRGPRVVPGALNRVAAFVLGRLVPRTTAVAVMASSTRELS